LARFSRRHWWMRPSPAGGKGGNKGEGPCFSRHPHQPCLDPHLAHHHLNATNTPLPVSSQGVMAHPHLAPPCCSRHHPRRPSLTTLYRHGTSTFTTIRAPPIDTPVDPPISVHVHQIRLTWLHLAAVGVHVGPAGLGQDDVILEVRNLRVSWGSSSSSNAKQGVRENVASSGSLGR
jgi:hypothetical protein